MQPKTIVVFDIDGVIRDVGGSYRLALADTVEHFTHGAYRPTSVEIDELKAEGIWNNDWEASRELISRHYGQPASDYEAIVAFFQSRYRGTDEQNWTGYICHEPLLLPKSYFEQLTAAGIPWGFFSGATRASANYVLEKRLGLNSPVLVAMEDAPGKPDPTGLFATVSQLANNMSPVIYVGDTVADMYTVEKARTLVPNQKWIGVGILPPHVQETPQRRDAYTQTLLTAGAAIVFSNVQELTVTQIHALL